ncbi:MAG: ABC transporter ATP-binding protein [Bacteroidota bacterium]
MIEIKNISKSYSQTKALVDVSLNIKKGKLFGLIGPDGAGKSTLFRILTTLLIPDKGTATLMGFDTVKDYKEIRKIIGYMPGKFSLYMDLSVQENLEFFAKVFNTSIEANYDMIKEIYVMLEPFKDRRASDLSGGMKQKLALCCALIHKPEILLLDEPTFGVDPVSRKEFWDNLKKLQKNENLTTLVSTPYMDEASMCDDIALIQNGTILTVDTPANICNNFSHTLYEIKTNDNYRTLVAIRELEEINSAFMFGNSIHITLNNNKIEIIEEVLSKNSFDFSVKIIKANIEDSFMELMTRDNE